jgi:hypothetical protein
MASNIWSHPLRSQLEQALREGSQAKVEEAVNSFLGDLEVFVLALDMSQRLESQLEVMLYTRHPVTEEFCEQLHLFTELLQEVSGRAAKVQLLTVTEQFYSRDFPVADTVDRP